MIEYEIWRNSEGSFIESSWRMLTVFDVPKWLHRARRYQKLKFDAGLNLFLLEFIGVGTIYMQNSCKHTYNIPYMLHDVCVIIWIELTRAITQQVCKFTDRKLN